MVDAKLRRIYSAEQNDKIDILNTCGNSVPIKDQIVCNEVFEKLPKKNNIDIWRTDWMSEWKIDYENCSHEARKPNWGKLLTVLIFCQDSSCLDQLQIQESFRKFYPGINVIQGTLSDTSTLSYQTLRIVKAVNASAGWWDMIKLVKTPYVLLGRSLSYLSNASKLERSIRLLQDPMIHLVSGATQNVSGHWKANCLQSNIINYNLYLKPGYEHSSCDCMICHVSDNAPIMIKTKMFHYLNFRLNTSLAENVMFLDWQMRLQKSYLKAIVCPDILYHTFKSHPTIKTLSRKDWLALSRLHQFQGVVLDHAPKISQSFTCEQAGLICNPMNFKDNLAILLPWCCYQRSFYILSLIEELSVRYNFHYEVDGGTVLGGIKLGNFLPWDVDTDITLNIEAFKLFEEGGKGRAAMINADVSVAYALGVRDVLHLTYKGLKLDMELRTDISINLHEGVC